MITYAIGMRNRFRGITQRRGMIWRGPAGWAEWSPFEDYDVAQSVPWLHAAREAAIQGWPTPRRTEIEVNCTVPVVAPGAAHRIALESGCRTAKVKVAEPGQRPSDDVARVAAVRDALGPSEKVRVDANGGWTIDEAFSAIGDLTAFDLEYVEQPCATADELATLRRRLARSRHAVPIAADESIRRAGDPYRVAELGAADIAILKVQPLGGVRRCLTIADGIGLPVVVSSAVETSIGIRAGLALAAALPELPYACGLNTISLLTDDVANHPLIADAGVLRIPQADETGFDDVDDEAVRRCAAPAAVAEQWERRLTSVAEAAGLSIAELESAADEPAQEPEVAVERTSEPGTARSETAGPEPARPGRRG
jgi:O-succinylbenzoate synthase